MPMITKKNVKIIIIGLIEFSLKMVSGAIVLRLVDKRSHRK